MKQLDDAILDYHRKHGRMPSIAYIGRFQLELLCSAYLHFNSPEGDPPTYRGLKIIRVFAEDYLHVTGDPAPGKRWSYALPKLDGDYFYSGPTPGNDEDITAVVHIITHPANNQRYASAFIPGWWKGDVRRRGSVVYAARLEEWTGKWTALEAPDA